MIGPVPNIRQSTNVRRRRNSELERSDLKDGSSHLAEESGDQVFSCRDTIIQELAALME